MEQGFMQIVAILSIVVLWAVSMIQLLLLFGFKVYLYPRGVGVKRWFHTLQIAGIFVSSCIWITAYMYWNQGHVLTVQIEILTTFGQK